MIRSTPPFRPAGSQTLNQILWQTPVDLIPHTAETISLFITARQSSPGTTPSSFQSRPAPPTVSRSKVAPSPRALSNGLKPPITSLPAHSWIPSFSVVLTPKNRLYLPGPGGTVYYRDNPDATGSAPTGQIAFYGLANYTANPAAYQDVRINTPITTDRYGNIFFGFYVTGSNPLNLQSGIARISSDGIGTWMSASTLANDNAIKKVVHNCAPALSNDHKTLYVAVSTATRQTVRILEPVTWSRSIAGPWRRSPRSG